MTRDDLNSALMEAFAADDRDRIAQLYAAAAEETEDASEAAFFLTHAYVFALECGSPEAPNLRKKLVLLGAEREA
ncbi:MAG: hypothetical protein AAF689_17875 [Pseudomonadota bacterium]